MVLANEADTTAGDPAQRNKQQLRTERARRKICEAVVDCLDAYGYSETTINRIHEAAGISRGALTHHFPNKEEIMVEAVDYILAPARNPIGRRRSDEPKDPSRSVERDLLRIWSRIVDTKEGRALVEILVAARTDSGLHERIYPGLCEYDRAFNGEILKLYRSVGRDDEDVATLWTICRIFLRGLHIQERFGSSPEQTSKIMKRFAEIIGPHMMARKPD